MDVQDLKMTRAFASEAIGQVIDNWGGFKMRDWRGPFPQVEFCAEVLRKMGFR